MMPSMTLLAMVTARCTGAPGKMACAALVSSALAECAFMIVVVCVTATGTWPSHTPPSRLCPVAAPSDAPGPRLRRINVIPCCCSRWSMALADAVCWGLMVVAVSRSWPYVRTRQLGFFTVNLVDVQDLLSATGALGARTSVSSSAAAHPRPHGPALVASPVTRTVMILADPWPPCVEWPDPRAGACAFFCSASSSAV